MAVRNVWTLRHDNMVVSYEVIYTVGCNISESILNLHREIEYVFGGCPLDISLDSRNALGNNLSLVKQKLNDKAVIDVCNELLLKDPSSEHSEAVTAITFDWVYIQAIIQKFGADLDLSNFTHFTDVRMQYGADYSSARAIAEFKALKQMHKLSLLSSFENFSVWRVNHVSDTQESHLVKDDYRIVLHTDDHVSVISRLPRNIISIVADSYGMQLWCESGKYILYTGCFDEDWLHDFVTLKEC